uniref:Plant-specific domain TIGR01615 family protein n=1 Tax=Kalanchoe fedtschenkoi TaxID=63787 RepID=A0A7N0ZWG2_KALFE
MDCGVCSPVGDVWMRFPGGGAGQIGGGFSHESEHDLALMVSDFLENGSGGADSRCSSDSDSAHSDLAHLADKICYFKHSEDHFDHSFIPIVHSLLLSISEIDLHVMQSAPCNGSCIRFHLVKLLRKSGYDAGVCSVKWQGSGKVPGGDHEYIDVAANSKSGSSDRLVIDIDFRSHFEIARAVDSYNRILNNLPVVYVGSLARLKQFLPIMVEAARSSLKHNSMPLPPWRSLAYLQAKWHSPYQRMFNPDENCSQYTLSSNHKQCRGHLKRLQTLLRSEIGVEPRVKSTNIDKNKRMKLRAGHGSFKLL